MATVITAAACTTQDCGKITSGNSVVSAAECTIETGMIKKDGVYIANKCAITSIEYNDCSVAAPDTDTISDITMAADPDAYFYRVSHLAEQFNSAGNEEFNLADGTQTDTHELTIVSTQMQAAARCFYKTLKHGSEYHVLVATKCGVYLLLPDDCTGTPNLSEGLTLSIKNQTLAKGTTNTLTFKSNTSAFKLIPLQGAAISAKLNFGPTGILKL